MKTLLYMWQILPPVGRFVLVAAPAVFVAGIVAGLLLGGRS